VFSADTDKKAFMCAVSTTRVIVVENKSALLRASRHRMAD